jgi:hypothetical protein
VSDQLIVQLTTVVAGESRLSKECMVLLRKKKKDFLSGEECPLVFLKRNVSRVNKA